MSQIQTQATSNESRLDEALAEYMERSDLGESVDRGEFLEKYPDIRSELSAFFHVADQLAEVQMGQLLEGRKPRSLVESLAAASPLKQATKKPAAPTALPEDTEDGNAKDEPPPESRRLQAIAAWLGYQYRAARPVLVSAVLHVVALILLASISLSLPALQEIVPILVLQQDSDDPPTIEPMVKIDLPQAEAQSAEVVQSVSLSDSVEISSLDDAPSSIRTDLSEVSSQQTMSFETLVRSPGKGDGLGKAGMGKVKFFGQSTSGKKFVFVLDNSGSMTKGRFETSLYELQSAVEQMQPSQMFYVFFFSDMAYPLFHPEPAYGFVPATPANKHKLAVWLRTIETNLRTEGLEAMQKALALRPDVIYLLGDGAFTDKTNDFLSKFEGGPQIHVLGMEITGKHAESFKAIAEKFKGTYKDVGIRPEMAQIAKDQPRPFNKKRGSVWGLKLPQ